MLTNLQETTTHPVISAEACLLYAPPHYQALTVTSCFCWARPLWFSAAPRRWDGTRWRVCAGWESRCLHLSSRCGRAESLQSSDLSRNTTHWGGFTSSSLVHTLTQSVQSGSEYLGVCSLSHRLTDLRDPIQNPRASDETQRRGWAARNTLCVYVYSHIYINMTS